MQPCSSANDLLCTCDDPVHPEIRCCTLLYNCTTSVLYEEPCIGAAYDIHIYRKQLLEIPNVTPKAKLFTTAGAFCELKQAA